MATTFKTSQHIVLLQGQHLAHGQAKLPSHQVFACQRLGHRVFDLQACVHFHEIKRVWLVGAGVEQKFDSAGALVTHCACHFHRGFAQLSAQG